MRPEAPIFFLSEDNTMLDVHRTTDDAEQHLSGGHLEDGRLTKDLLFFDGLARPVEARSVAHGVKLVVSSPLSDPWQVRARALEAIQRGTYWIAAQGDDIVIADVRISKEEAELEIGKLDVSYDSSFAEFTQTLVSGFQVVQRHRGSFLHNLFHG